MAVLVGNDYTKQSSALPALWHSLAIDPQKVWFFEEGDAVLIRECCGTLKRMIG